MPTEYGLLFQPFRKCSNAPKIISYCRRRMEIMIDTQTTLSKTFTDFFDSEKSGGVLLIICTIASLALN